MGRGRRIWMDQPRRPTMKGTIMKIRKRFSERVQVGVACTAEEKRTKGSFKEECDINKIIARAKKSGMLPPSAKVPVYGDFADVPSYQAALDLVIQAEAAFAALPADVRAECFNSPQVFLEKVKDENWAIAKGLAVKKEAASTSEKSTPPENTATSS